MKFPESWDDETNGLSLTEVYINTKYYGTQNVYTIDCKVPSLGPDWADVSVEAESLNDAIRFLAQSILEHYTRWLQENNG